MGRTPEQRATTGGDGDNRSPGQILRDVHALQGAASAAGRGYWLPLLLFGALICGSLPFYEILRPPPQGRITLPRGSGHCTFQVNHPCKVAAGAGHVSVIGGHLTVVTALGYYWQAAIPVAVVLTVLWYRWRGSRVGLRTPALGFLIIGLVLAEFVLLVPLLAAQSGSLIRLLHDTHQAGPFVIIAVLLWVLAWAERSPGLAIVTACYLAVALVISGLTNGGIAGGTTGAADLSLAALRLLGLLPALILLAAGLVTRLSQQWQLRSQRLASE